MTTGRVLPVGYGATVETKTIAAISQIAIQQGVASSWQVDISHLGIVKNA